MNPVPEPEAAVSSHDGCVILSETCSSQQGVAQLLASHRPTRLLLDATALPSLPKPSHHLFGFVESLARSLPRAARVALVVRPDQIGRARLIEKAARKAGAFLTYFIDRQKAERWVQRHTFPRHYLLPPGPGQPPFTTTVTALMEEAIC
jgi:hypothetical protein